MNWRRVAAIVCMVVFLSACAFACSDHHCIGEGCDVCALLNQIRRLLFIAVSAAFIAFRACLCASYSREVSGAVSYTDLISAKVRLND